MVYKQIIVAASLLAAQTEAVVTLKNLAHHEEHEFAILNTKVQTPKEVIGQAEFHTIKPHLEFDEYVSQHGKVYLDPVEYAEHKSIYQQNLKKVEALNANPDDDAFYTVNNYFGDVETKMVVTPPMFSNDKLDILTDKRLSGENPTHLLGPLSTEGVPESFDWRDHGAVTSVRNQGAAGSCWSFSAAEATEGAQFIKHGSLEKLSPEFLVECDPRDCGVYGGLPSLAYEFVMAEGGMVKEKSVPYCAGGGPHECTPCMAPHYNQTLCGKVKQGYCNHDRNVCDIEKMHPDSIGAKIVDWKQLTEDEDQIKAALVKYGPLSVALNAQWLQYYSWGISNPFYCPPVLDHAVLIVGYGTELGYFTGRQKPYWIVKNSWSENWGEKGYFRLARGKGACGIDTAVTFPVVA